MTPKTITTQNSSVQNHTSTFSKTQWGTSQKSGKKPDFLSQSQALYDGEQKRYMLPNKVEVNMHENRLWNWRHVPNQINKAIKEDLMVAIKIQKHQHDEMRRDRIKNFFMNKVDRQQKISVFEDFAKQIGLDKRNFPEEPKPEAQAAVKRTMQKAHILNEKSVEGSVCKNHTPDEELYTLVAQSEFAPQVSVSLAETNSQEHINAVNMNARNNSQMNQST